MKGEFEAGQLVVCVNTSIVELAGYLSEGKRVSNHRDVILSEKTILKSVAREEKKAEKDRKRIFVPKLEIERVFVSTSGKVFLSFVNDKGGRKTPAKYRLNHMHPAYKFRRVDNEEDHKVD